MQTVENMGDSIFDPLEVPPSLVDVQRFLRVANEVEPDNLRVAYLCRIYAFEKARRLDPTSSGPGVRQFKTSLLQALERDNMSMNEKSDSRRMSDKLEMQHFYLHYCQKFIKTLQNAVNKSDRDLLTKSFQTEAVLFEVLKAVNGVHTIEVDQEVLEMHCQIEAKKRGYYRGPPMPPPPPPPPPMPLSQWAKRGYYFGPNPTPPEEKSGSEGSNDSSTSDYKGLIDAFRDRSISSGIVLD